LGGFIRITQDIGSRNTNYLVAFGFQSLRALCVTFGAIAHVVSGAIHFYYQFGGRAVEVHAVAADRVLFTEGDALRGAFEALPQQYFGQAHVATCRAGFVYLWAA
jgi:hypothetical protein